MNFKLVHPKSGVGTRLQGYLDASYSQIVAALGQPNGIPNRKVDAEWVIRFDDDTVATIYNYKTGKNYLGPVTGLPTEAITDWHIGGESYRAVEILSGIFPGRVMPY